MECLQKPWHGLYFLFILDVGKSHFLAIIQNQSQTFCPTTAMANKDCDQDFCEELKKFFDSRGGSVKVRELKEWLAENCKGRKNEVRNSTHSRYMAHLQYTCISTRNTLTCCPSSYSSFKCKL